MNLSQYANTLRARFIQFYPFLSLVICIDALVISKMLLKNAHVGCVSQSIKVHDGKFSRRPLLHTLQPRVNPIRTLDFF